MAPTRRYLRITRYSVLECRIYTENALDRDSWLLRKNDPALPRVMAAVRPLVLPKLREENERMKIKSGKGKNKAIKDDIVEQDFKVSIYLKDQPTRHSLLVKKKEFTEKPKLRSNSNRLTSWLGAGDAADKPIDVDAPRAPIMVEDEDDIDLSTIPVAQDNGFQDEDAVTIPSDDEGPGLFVSKKVRPEPENDDKKKLGMKVMYDGFAIYGKILCLVVKRTGTGTIAQAKTADSGQALMENWVSTQVALENGMDDEQA